jgi:nitrite reductase/ring-hydroxylating ferredoxin subunit
MTTSVSTSMPTAIGLSSAIETNQVIAAICGGTEYAVWRDSRGELHANQNRCPHRGMRLSFGFVRDDRLNCLYHGWSYDSGGQCRHIPAHPALTPPRTVCLQTFAVRERHGTIWLATETAAGDAGHAGSPSPLDQLALPPDLQATPVRSLYVAASLPNVRQAMARWIPQAYAPGQAASASAAFEHNALGADAGTVILRDDALPKQGVLFALQDVGDGRTGIHLAALWAGRAPADYLLALSRQLRVLGSALEQQAVAEQAA